MSCELKMRASNSEAFEAMPQFLAWPFRVPELIERYLSTFVGAVFMTIAFYIPGKVATLTHTSQKERMKKVSI